MHFDPVQDFAVSRNASYLLMSGNGFFILQFCTEKKKRVLLLIDFQVVSLLKVLNLALKR